MDLTLMSVFREKGKQRNKVVSVRDRLERRCCGIHRIFSKSLSGFARAFQQIPPALDGRRKFLR